MSSIKMARIKLPVMDRLLKAGYLPVQRGRYVEWSRGNSDSVWFARKEIQASSNNLGSEIIRCLAGKPDIRLSDNQHGTQDVWYTDGYVGQSYYNYLVKSLNSAMNRLAGFLKPQK
jgi:hypothetical protein